MALLPPAPSLPLWPPRRTAALAALDAFCRVVQAVTDDPEKPEPTKLSLLDELASQIDHEDWRGLPGFARPLAPYLARGACPPAEMLEFLAAMRRDAAASLYPGLPALLDHAYQSAASRGRMLLALAEESLADRAAVNAFFTAAQLLDYASAKGRYAAELGRIYLPQDWLAELGVEARMLTLSTSRGEVGQLRQWLLRVTDEQLQRAAALPGGLRSRRLKRAFAAAHDAMRSWSAALAAGDPLMQCIDAPAALRRVLPGW